MTTQAVYSELAGNLSTDTFILALRCFKARMGHLKRIPIDNRTNSIGAERCFVRIKPNTNHWRIK